MILLYNKKLLIHILHAIAIILILPLSGCNVSENFGEYGWPPDGEDQIIMRAAFLNMPTQTYYFTLSRNGVLEASWGCHGLNTHVDEINWEGITRWGELDPSYFHHFGEDLVDMLGVIEEIETYQLTKANFYNLIELLEMLTNIPDDQETRGMSLDGLGHASGSEFYSIFLNYRDTFFIFGYSDSFRSGWEAMSSS